MSEECGWIRVPPQLVAGEGLIPPLPLWGLPFQILLSFSWRTSSAWVWGRNLLACAFLRERRKGRETTPGLNGLLGGGWGSSGPLQEQPALYHWTMSLNPNFDFSTSVQGRQAVNRRADNQKDLASEITIFIVKYSRFQGAILQSISLPKE